MTLDLDELERAANAIRPDQRGVPAFSAEQVLAIIARLREAERCADLTWFWEIVDRDGLNNVASDERKALSELVRYAAERDRLKAELAISRAAALEEAAKVAEQTDEDGSRLWPDGPEIAAAILAEAQKDGG